MNSARDSRTALTLHPERCTGCLSCQLACSLQHEGSCSTRWARLGVTESGDGEVFVLEVCRQCKDAPCVEACGYGALFDEGPIVALDSALCNGCGECADACPYGAIFFDPREGKALKCDLCDGRPRCVTYCETVALEFDIPGGDPGEEPAGRAAPRLGWPI